MKSTSRQKPTSDDRLGRIGHGNGGGDANHTLIKRGTRDDTFTKPQSKSINKATIKQERDQNTSGEKRIQEWRSGTERTVQREERKDDGRKDEESFAI